MLGRTPAPLTVRGRRGLRASLMSVQLLVAVTAVAGAVGMLADNMMALPDSWLADTPFRTWQWPAVLLLGVVAVPLSAALIGEVRREAWAPLASTVAGSILVIWVVVQVVLIRHYFALQPVLAAAGVVVVLLSARLHRGGPPRRPTDRRVAMRRV